MPVTGRLISAVMSLFCTKGTDDPQPRQSIGVAKDSIAATDGLSAIVIGLGATEYDATDWREADIEASAADNYNRPYEFDTLERLVDDDGQVRPFPAVGSTIQGQLSRMVSVAKLSPAALERIAKIASKAGAATVEIFQPSEEGQSTLGFQFQQIPELHHPDWGMPITFQGIVTVQEARAGKAKQYAMVLEEDGEPEPKKKNRKGNAKPVAAVIELVQGGAADDDDDPGDIIDVEADRESGGMLLPKVALLDEIPPRTEVERDRSGELVVALASHKVSAEPIKRVPGPTVTQYQVKLARGVAVSKVQKLESDIQMALSSESVRIQAPIPGTPYVGFEVPNDVRQVVTLRRMIQQEKFWKGGPLTCAVGIDISGNFIYQDLTSLPHLLIGGATNSGKSIGLASLIMSLLMRNSPKELRMLMIDPKRVELSLFDGIPHLLCPVVKDVKEAPGVLRAVWREMDIRYDLFSEEGVRNIEGWNQKVGEDKRLPFIVVVIDELADMMIQAGPEVETSIVRLAQLARAVGIHLVIATQRPSVDVITGLIKANVPSRMAFAVSSGVDSKVILDHVGAEQLVGRGDMLFLPMNKNKPLRTQGPYVSEAEIERVVGYWKSEAPAPEYTLQPPTEEGQIEVDPALYAQAVAFVVDRGMASTSMIQRQFSLGFQTSSRLLERMEQDGIVGPRDGPRPREVLMNQDDAKKAVGGGS